MILITGATGTVGSEVLKRLSAQDVAVSCGHARSAESGSQPAPARPVRPG